MRFVENKLKIY